ncbi:hypothetical protein HNQ59_000816 [Chitinivorax tropicus]|uniref:Uncharacterized protein n=1 Tax=Chitinivorax tropicus TaxID=714531 RepID=A0A840ML01_9PROT|nr:hypothetical protein [Chitinivorax tropicus]MBB5017547.1 hypothetical protein [Chitinivorax tropicus]
MAVIRWLAAAELDGEVFWRDLLGCLSVLDPVVGIHDNLQAM